MTEVRFRDETIERIRRSAQARLAALRSDLLEAESVPERIALMDAIESAEETLDLVSP